MMGPRERRLKLVDISDGEVFDFFVYAVSGKNPAVVALPSVAGIPDGAVVEQVVHDPWLRVFRATISHPSFDVAPDGMTPPPLFGPPATVTRRVFKLTAVDTDDADKPTTIG